MADDVNEVADDGDVLPAELDISGLTGAYEFPNNAKRRLAAVLYLTVAVIGIGLGVLVDSPLVNTGVTVVGVGLALFAVYSWFAAAETRVDEAEALVIAASTSGVAAGPSSAQMIWRGWMSRPAWRILVYSTEVPQPATRALIIVDAVNGDVIESLVEDNPEDWSQLAR